MLSTIPLVAGGTCGPHWKKANVSDWSRCSVVFKWILTYNVQTLKLANCATPTHLLRPLFTIYMEPESQKSERLLTVLGGERLEVMWKAVRWPYRYLGRRQSSNICVNPSSCEPWIWFPCDGVGPALPGISESGYQKTNHKLLRWCNNQSRCEDLHSL